MTARPGSLLLLAAILGACGGDVPEAARGLDCAGFDLSRNVDAIPSWPADRPAPVDLAVSRRALDGWLDEPQRLYLGCADLEVITANIHFGLALWIRNNWSFEPATPLGATMQSMGLQHPDDISNLIATHYVYAIRGKVFDTDREVQRYTNYWTSGQ